MKKIVVLLLLTSLSVFSQRKPMPGDWDFKEPEYTPFNKENDENTYGVKAKLLPFFWGNGLVAYSSIGAEIGFFKNQSITIETFFNYTSDSQDDVTDLNGNAHESGNESHTNDLAFQVGYRYYYSFQKWRKDLKVTFYNGVFGRAERDKIYFDKNFNNPYVNKIFNVRAFGITTGIIHRFKNSEHLGIDYNFSLGKSYTKTETYNRNVSTSTKEKHDSFYFNAAISLNYWF